MFRRRFQRAALLGAVTALTILLQGCFPSTQPRNGAGEPVDPHTGNPVPGATLPK